MPNRGSSEPARPFTVLMVCTGNICRSPLAEQLLRSRLGEAGLHASTTVSSAGLGAVVGAPMEEHAAAVSLHFRGQPGEFRARQLRSAMVADADLVLTMTRAQRDEVIKRNPRALQRTFTLTEFSKLLSVSGGVELVETATDAALAEAALLTKVPGALPADAAADLADSLRPHVQQLARIRSRAQLLPEDDVTDPYRQSQQVHDAVGRQISLATSHLALNIVGWVAEARNSGRLSA
ncbi:hypothetical protein [Subtercola boreus]|nr:hypothetical protein [Subtercola boreus]